jgi:hypothetical protein
VNFNLHINGGTGSRENFHKRKPENTTVQFVLYHLDIIRDTGKEYCGIFYGKNFQNILWRLNESNDKLFLVLMIHFTVVNCIGKTQRIRILEKECGTRKSRNK